MKIEHGPDTREVGLVRTVLSVDVEQQTMTVTVVADAPDLTASEP